MISSGLFVLPGIVFEDTGPSLLLSYLLASLMMIPTMFAKAELSTAMPKAGGDYFFIERSLGPLAGTLGGFSNWLSISLKSAFALIGIGGFMELIKPGVPYGTVKLIAAGFCILFTVINLKTVKGTGKVQTFLVFLMLGLLGFYIITGLKKINLSHFTPFIPYGIRPVLTTSGLIFISYGGLTKIASVAEEIENPGKIIPLGMFLAFGIVSAIYLLVVWVTIGVLEPSLLKNSLTPICHGARAVSGIPGEILLAVCAMLAFVTTANAGILSASRSPMAMSRDGLLPPLFAKTSRTGIPYVSVLLTSGFMLAVILLLPVKVLVEVASTLMLMLFMFVNFSLIIMRESGIEEYKPSFRAPFYPYLQLLGIIIYLFFIFEMGILSLLISFVFLVVWYLWYRFYVKKRVRRVSALVYVMRKIVAREIFGKGVEEELFEIVMERDRMLEDRFNRLISRSPILDLEGPMSFEEFVKVSSKVLSSHLGIPREKIEKLLKEREEISSTVIGKGLAIPHIIVEGEKKFEMLIVRCRKGIEFPEGKVHVAFVMAGTLDERNFYLRTLASLVEIVREKDFIKRWLSLKDEPALRRFLILQRKK